MKLKRSARAVEKAPGGWRSPRRFAHAGAVKFAPAFWTAAALRRFVPGNGVCSATALPVLSSAGAGDKDMG